MELGCYTRQVALVFSQEGYQAMRRRLDPSWSAPPVEPLAYLVLVARQDAGGQESWTAINAGGRQAVRGRWPAELESTGGTGTVAWLEQVVDTAVPIEGLSMTMLKGVQVQLRLDAMAVARASADPVTVALVAEGAFDAEQSRLNLQVDHPAALARRLSWLMNAAVDERRMEFDLAPSAEMGRLGQYLVRQHGWLLQRSAR